MNKFPAVWGGGQLIAFSGIDGQTDFKNGLCDYGWSGTLYIEMLNHPEWQ